MDNVQSLTKIVLIIPTLTAGGSERFLTLVANHLDKSRYEVHFIVINGKVRFFPLVKSVFFYDLETLKVRNSLFKIRHLLRKIRPQIVLSTLGHLNLLLSIFRFLFPKSIKFIARESTVLHSSLAHSDNQNTHLYNTLYRLFSNKNAIVCQSKDMKDSLLDLGIKAGNMEIINNPVDVKAIQKKSKETCNEYYDLLTVGRLNKVKGYDRLLQIIKAYKKEFGHKNIKLAIIGDGKERVNLEKRIEQLDLKGNVYLLGHQKNPYKYFKNTRLFIMTSFYEGFPNVLIEAGSCGLPSVAYNVPGGIKEIIQDSQNGFLVKDGATKEMAKVINKALHYPFDSEAIIASTEQRFGLDLIIKKYERMFERVVRILK